jgi:hypothetical protein
MMKWAATPVAARVIIRISYAIILYTQALKRFSLSLRQTATPQKHKMYGVEITVTGHGGSVRQSESRGGRNGGKRDGEET